MKWYHKVLAGSAGVTGAGIVAWKTMFPWIEYDLQMVNVGKKLLKVREEAMKTMLIDKFEEQVAKHPKKPFIIFEDNVYTYEFVDQMACKVANLARSFGLKMRDCVAIMIENEPSFIWTFLGFQKLGISVAFINHNLKMHPLVHSVLAADPKYLIVGSGDHLTQSALEVLGDLGKIKVYVQGLGSAPAPYGLHSFDAALNDVLPAAVSPTARSGLTMEDICCYIYTSGTTGNPKAAVVREYKMSLFGLVLQFAELESSDYVYTSLPLYHSSGSLGFCGVLLKGNPKPVFISLEKAGTMCCVTQCVALCGDDCLYMVLPLYHSAGGGSGMFGVIYQGDPKPAYIRHGKCLRWRYVMQSLDMCPSDTLYMVLPIYHSAGGIGYHTVIQQGATMVLRRKFSARHFMEDCRKHNVTVIQYIGELFRYLLAQPPNALDSQHNIRAAFGNGLRKDIWLEVNNRFKIPNIVEFFGATEGTTMLLNLANRPGAIGRLSPILNTMDPDPKALVKFDLSTALPIRDKNGRCIKVEMGEPGLFLSKVPDFMLKDGTLKVYRSSDEANEKKLVRDAFQPGDVYFNYGDVFVLDKDYFLYFQDRIGDTFRWKGENVSTTELANVITALPFIEDANVYGVLMPGGDGRAGMAALTLKSGKSLTEREMKEIYDHVCQELPTYARPLFIRQLSEAIITGTFKQRKVELVKEGYDLNLIKDPMFFLDNAKKTYSPLKQQDLTTFLASKL